VQVKGQGVSKQAPYDNTSNNGAGGAVGTTAAAGGGTGGVVVAKPLEGPMFQKVAVAAPVPAKTPTPVVSKSALAELIKTKSGINNAYSDFATYVNGPPCFVPNESRRPLVRKRREQAHPPRHMAALLIRQERTAKHCCENRRNCGERHRIHAVRVHRPGTPADAHGYPQRLLVAHRGRQWHH